jgi:hypothetical protein
MKRIKYYLATLITSVLLLTSCSESFFDINSSPNNPTVATPALVLPSGLAGSAYVMGGYYQALGGFWTQQYAQGPAASQWADWESFNLAEDDFNRQFTTLYAGALLDYENVRLSSAASKNWKFYTISTLMQAYTYQVLADLYDKVPFTEALQGTKNLQPKYDDGKVVYDSLIARIDGAIAKDFSAASVEAPGKSDLIFKGEMSDWIKFANTLKLKIYMRYVNVDPTKNQAKIQALLADNNFLDKDAAFSAFKAEETGYNPFYNTFINRLAGNIVANSYLMNILDTNTDPRKAKFFTASETGATYKAMASGDSKNHPTENSKNYATPSIGGLSSVYFFTKEEALFLVAEAQARYGTAVAAEAAFNAGVKASLASLGLAENAITYPYAGIQSIMEQKYIAATNKRAIEAFFDYNRTGFPIGFTFSETSVFGKDASGNPILPKRLFFPDSERKSNANTPAKVPLTQKVWWGK